MTEKNWRLINTNYNNAYLNMAIDEALLISEKPVLRLYRWKPAALSLGYSQRMDEINLIQCEKLGIDYVRRLTGGKAVLHDKELTYSFIINEDAMPKRIIDSYMVISNAILFALKKLGINAYMKESVKMSETQRVSEHAQMSKKPCFFEHSQKSMIFDESSIFDKSKSSAICFNEPSYYEITAKNKKLVGSAQTRKNSKLLQHGSILLDIDIEKMCSLFRNCNKRTINLSKKRITSLKEINGNVNCNTLIRAIKKGFEENFQIRLYDDELSDNELKLAKKLAKEKYSSKQ